MALDRQYTAPSLEELGSVSELTLGGRNGNSLDNDFPAGTPRGDLTFS